MNNRLEASRYATAYISNPATKWPDNMKAHVRAALLMWQECPQLAPYPESEAYALKWEWYVELFSNTTQEA